jgi:hypothetical protein
MPLTANFIADFSSFINAAASATTATDELVNAAGNVGRSMDDAVEHAASSMRSVGSAVADFGRQAWSVLNSSQLKQFAGDVTSFVGGFVNEFAEAERAAVRLETAVKNAGHSPEVAAAYEQLATDLQKVSRFSDEALTDAMTLFTTIGNVGPEAMKPAIQAAMDLAIGLGVTLPEASKLMVRAAESDGEAIGKLKLILGDTIPKGASFAEVIDAINKKFGGQSLADIQSTAGGMENLKNQMSDINEQVGKVFAETLKTLFDWFHALPEGIQTFAIAVVAIGTALAPVLVSLSSLASLLGATGLGAVLLDAAAAVATFVAGLLGWPALIIAGIAALAYGIYKYWDEIVAFFKGAVDKISYVLTQVLPKAFTSVVESVKNMYYGIEYWIKDKLTTLFDYVGSTVIPGFVQGFKNAANQIVGFSIIPDMVDDIGTEFNRLNRVMVDPAWDAADEASKAFSSIGDAALPTLGAGGFGAAGGGVTVTVNMTGMLGADDPQTRALVSDLVSNAVMQGMRGGRLLGTA